jgi:hypothetical protein
MEDSERIRKQKELIEQIGIQARKTAISLQRPVLALLMVMDKEEYTLKRSSKRCR